MPAMARAKTGIPPSFSAGLASIFNLAFFGWESAVQISKLIWWGFAFYIIFGIAMTVAQWHSTRPADWLFGVYFTMYAILGLLYHSRELHLDSLHAAIGAEDRVHDKATLKTSLVSTISAGRRALEWKRANTLAKIYGWSLVLYIIFCATITSVCSHSYWGPAIACSEGDCLWGLYATMHAVMMLLWFTRRLEIGRWRAEGEHVTVLSKEQASAAANTAKGRPIMLTKIIFWTYPVYILILVSIAYAYRDLPSTQWKYTTQAVACAVWRMNHYINLVLMLRKRGDIFY